MSDDAKPDYAIRLTNLIDRSGHSQSEIARQAGLTRDAVSRYCLGRTRPPAAKLKVLSHILGVHPTDIDPSRVSMSMQARPKPAGAMPYHVSGAPERGDDQVHLRVDTILTVGAMERIVQIIDDERAGQQD